jgi:hypothetical protein
MPFETPFSKFLFAGVVTSLQQENGGAYPETIIRTSQSWAVTVSWTTTGLATGMIAGDWHLHLFLESIGPGPDLDLIDADSAEHIIPLTPGPSPVHYSVRVDVPATAVVAPGQGRLYKLAASLTYFEPGGAAGPMAAFEEGPILQFYDP